MPRTILDKDLGPSPYIGKSIMKTDPDEALKNWTSTLMEQAQIADFEGF